MYTDYSSCSELMHTIKKLYDLKDDWDQNGSLAPKRSDIENAVQFAELIAEKEVKNPLIEISCTGEISFGWKDRAIGLVVDIGFINGGYSYYAKDIDGEIYLKDSTSYENTVLTNLLSIPGIKYESCHRSK